AEEQKHLANDWAAQAQALQRRYEERTAALQQSVADRSKDQEMLVSALAQVEAVRHALSGAEARLTAGTYELQNGMSARSILDLFVAGRQALVRFTLPEGFTIRQAAALLDRKGIAEASDFISASNSPELLADFGIPAASLQGYLFPDTYYFPMAYGGEAVARAMVGAFREKISALEEATALDPRELHAKIILASIIEREYRLSEEAPLMAGVFANRLRIGMALQSCATVVYVITEVLSKPHPEALFDRDLKIDDPYNTYLHSGLPPGPIANPGLTAIDAALRPAKTDYLYFRLVDADLGRHRFSRTLEEHVGARSFAVKRIGG
ncbi:MAG: endolytic transglycosylase MltG, partial [Spirochaetaceae bacterium]|nr:endolytic transglycosylase MltG [Spirochaetaceae bacterium]